jgi:hypothetical protein
MISLWFVLFTFFFSFLVLFFSFSLLLPAVFFNPKIVDKLVASHLIED